MRNRASLALVAAFLLSCPAAAHEFKVGPIEIVHPWARATPAGAKTGAGYLTIVNRGNALDRLIAVECACAASASLHETKVENDVARMIPVPSLDVPSGETAKFKPGGLHIMFMGLKQPFAEEDRIEAALVFEKAGRVAVEFYVQGLASQAPVHDE